MAGILPVGGFEMLTLERRRRFIHVGGYGLLSGPPLNPRAHCFRVRGPLGGLIHVEECGMRFGLVSARPGASLHYKSCELFARRAPLSRPRRTCQTRVRAMTSRWRAIPNEDAFA